MEILDNLDPLLRTFWFIAIPASLIFMIQTISTFIGADATDGLDADFDSNLDGTDEPFQLFSFRNLINFLLGFSWGGISFYGIVSSPMLLIVLSLVIGLTFVGVFFMIIQQIRKLAEDNSFKLSNTIDRTGEVYLTIPAAKTGTGKIMISVGGSVHVLDAITEYEQIETGSVVKVTRVGNNNFLTVEKV
ncbi:serine protease [Dyadobacter sp. CY312]|uniref:serine protease n=1 Tax=Dyadobacter sp. CY312 TaxID=2907303 RepID=UPI001F2079D1|nr:serine protease [Dyadobacter sp. CY312]MCE7041732.1 serine protease [Dyadobacter sp. CY312]